MVKSRLQVDPQLYKSNLKAWRSIYSEEGLRGVFFGWSPTLVGYSLQGAGKYGLYEVFKQFYGEELFPNANNYIPYTLFAYRSARQELTQFSPYFLLFHREAYLPSDIALCPFEAVKLRMQTTLPPDAHTLREGWRKIAEREGPKGLYKGLQPLWGRQIPYTMMKFATFEKTVEYIYRVLGQPKETFNKFQQTGVSFVAGYIAGIASAVVSHPADVMVSKLNAEKQRKPVFFNPVLSLDRTRD